MSDEGSERNEDMARHMAPQRAHLGALKREEWLVLFLLFAVLFIAFRWAPHLDLVDAFFGADTSVFHDGFQLDSDSLVTGRLQQNSVGGLFSAAMTLGLDGSMAGPYGFYPGQFGLGGWLLALPSTLLGATGWFGIPLMYAMVAAGNALLATAAIAMISRAMSRGAAVLVTIALVQPWPSAMAHSIYWMIGLKLLPAAGLIVLFRINRDSPLRVLVVSLGLTLFAALSGYEFITIVIATQLSVITYYAVLRRTAVPDSLRLLAMGLVGSVAGFGLAIALHALQLSLKLGGLGSAVQAFAYTVSKRTGATGVEVDPVYAESLSSSPSSVLDTYLSMPMIGSPAALPLLRYFTVAILLAVCAAVIVVGFGRSSGEDNRIPEAAMGAAWFVALLGPLGWFLLARPHSYIHTHVNFALWYLPTIPLGLALLWAPTRRGLRGMRHQPLVVIVVVVTVVVTAVFFSYSLLSMR